MVGSYGESLAHTQELGEFESLHCYRMVSSVYKKVHTATNFYSQYNLLPQGAEAP